MCVFTCMLPFSLGGIDLNSGAVISILWNNLKLACSFCYVNPARSRDPNGSAGTVFDAKDA